MSGFASQFFGAFAITVGLALVSGVVGTTLGLALAIAKTSADSRVAAPITVYTTVVRGVPELVIILLIFFGGTALASAVTGQYVEVNAFSALSHSRSSSAATSPKCSEAPLRRSPPARPRRRSLSGSAPGSDGFW